ncbi:MAG: VOC family protein [Candidatus Dormibacteria bacterium]
MKVLGVNWVGLRSDDFAACRGFFSEVMGMNVSLERQDFAVFQLPDGGKLEIFGPQGPASPAQFQDAPVVAGFWVEDIEAARRELVAGGAELLGGVGGDPTGYRWQHFRTPEGRVFEISCDPGRPIPS